MSVGVDPVADTDAPVLPDASRAPDESEASIPHLPTHIAPTPALEVPPILQADNG